MLYRQVCDILILFMNMCGNLNEIQLSAWMSVQTEMVETFRTELCTRGFHSSGMAGVSAWAWKCSGVEMISPFNFHHRRVPINFYPPKIFRSMLWLRYKSNVLLLSHLQQNLSVEFGGISDAKLSHDNQYILLIARKEKVCGKFTHHSSSLPHVLAVHYYSGTPL